MSKTIGYILIVWGLVGVGFGQWLMWGFNPLNLHTLCLFIGFFVGFATCYSAFIWPVHRKQRYLHWHKCGSVWLGHRDKWQRSKCRGCGKFIEGTKI